MVSAWNPEIIFYFCFKSQCVRTTQRYFLLITTRSNCLCFAFICVGKAQTVHKYYQQTLWVNSNYTVMNQDNFAIEALKLLGEINAFDDFQQVNCIEVYYHQYKSLLSSHHTLIPARALGNLPFIAMGVQMAKIKLKPESRIRHVKRTCKWLKADLEYLVDAVSLSGQIA